MIEKNNIPLQNILTKKIYYRLNLDRDYWNKREYNDEGNEIYFEDSYGYWAKYEYDNEGDLIYYGTSRRGIIRDDR